VMGINTNTGANGTFNILATHTFPNINNFPISITITDARNDLATATNFIVMTGVAPPMAPRVTITNHLGNIILSWSGPGFSLQSSTNIAGHWNTLVGAASPYTTNVMSGTKMFFRLTQ
jgi:hypothetical protein